jgi:hypothetical protein
MISHAHEMFQVLSKVTLSNICNNGTEEFQLQLDSTPINAFPKKLLLQLFFLHDQPTTQDCIFCGGKKPWLEFSKNG